MGNDYERRVLELARQSGVLRSRDLAAEGIPRRVLSKLHNEGLLIRTARGLYILPDAEITEYHSLAQVAKRFPHGVVCLISALRFHKLTTQLPREVWLALPHKARQPQETQLPVRFVRFSGPAFDEGIEEHMLEKINVRIYNTAKTVADCFKYRNKIGLDVALEALRDCWRERKCSMDDLWRYANICRVSNVMRPYLESLV